LSIDGRETTDLPEAQVASERCASDEEPIDSCLKVH
jgi:hypothetical protein